MKCSVCKKKIEHEYKAILLNCDGDFACDKKCKDQYEKDKNEFFGNIGNDAWYEKNFFPLNNGK